MTERAISCAVVTGATKGIGKAIVLGLVPHARAIIAVARNEAELEALRQEVAGFAPDCSIETVAGDVSDPETARRAAEVATSVGGCDVLINTAGIFPPALLADITSDQVEQVMRVNFNGVLNFCQALVPDMIEKQDGRIVNVTSIAARSPTPGLSIYAASKGAVEAFSRSIAAELAPHVRVNCVSPGPTMTEAVRDLTRSDTTGAVDAVSKAIPMGRYGEPDEVASAAIFLATSTASRWMTGQTVQVNGGLLMA